MEVDGNKSKFLHKQEVIRFFPYFTHDAEQSDEVTFSVRT